MRISKSFVVFYLGISGPLLGQSELTFPDVVLCDAEFDLTIDLPILLDNSEPSLPYEALTGDELFVAINGDDVSGDGSSANPYATIQHAISQASDGMIVTVTDGTYSGFGNTGISPEGKDIVIQSLNGPFVTSVDGEMANQGFVVNSGETLSTVIRGFTIENTVDITGLTQAAGIFVEDNSGIGITHCIFQNNERCVRLGNTEVSGPQSYLESCAFIRNSGPAIYASKKSFYAHDCVFAYNEFESGSLTSNGHVADPAQEYRNCVYSCNSQAANLGHGKRMENSLFIHNSTPSGTMYTGTNWSGMNTIDHCTFAFNICNYYSSNWWDHMGDVRSSIFYPGDARDHVSGNQSVIDYFNSLGDGISGNGNIQGDPLFADADAMDYSLATGSPCIGSGEGGTDMGVDMTQLQPWLFSFLGDSAIYDIFVDGNLVEDEGPYTLENVTAGTHTVVYDGCDWSISAEFEVSFGAGTVEAGPDLVICPGEEVLLEATGADDYLWNESLSNGETVLVNQSTWFVVEGLGSNLCNPVDSFFVEVSTSNGEWGDWELLVNPSELPPSWSTDDYLFNRSAGSIFIKDWATGYAAEIDTESGMVTAIPITGWMEFTEMVYGDEVDKLFGWRAGTDDVYEVDASGGTWSLVVDGGFDATHYGASSYWNPVTENVGFFGGYGFFTTNNAVYEPVGMSGGWQEIISNSNDGNPPRMTGTPISPNATGEEMLLYGWHGNVSGSQYQCDLDILWSNGNYCWSRGLWRLDLANHEFTTILPLDDPSVLHLGDLAWDFNANELIVVGGQMHAPDANNTAQGIWTNSISTFDLGSSNGFEELSSSGLPVLEEFGQLFFDGELNCLIYLRSDGVWKSCKSSCIVEGCTDSTACNYDDEANTDDGTCTYAPASETAASACDEYVWNDQTLTQSGVYSEVFETGDACDSTATLNLTLYSSYNLQEEASACGGVNWNGSFLTESGTYTAASTSIGGCDSIITLDLIIFPTYESTVIVPSCNPSQEDSILYLSSMNGCDSVVHIVEELESPLAQAQFVLEPNPVTWPYEEIACSNLSVNAESVIWYVNGEFFSNEFEPDFSVLEVGIHVIVLAVENSSGCESTAAFELHVEEELQVFVPTAFSPMTSRGGDGVNDAFYPVLSSYESVYDYQFSIYNRWGEKVWSTQDPLQPWIGPAQVDVSYFVQDDVYTWTLTFKVRSSFDIHQYQGHVTVLR